jgi:hypothetical protein
MTSCPRVFEAIMSAFRFRSILVPALGLAALLACGSVSAVKPVAPAAHDAKPAAVKAPETLKFDKDGAVAKSKGAFKGPKTVARDFAVPMKAGQTLEVSLEDKPGTTYTYIYRPGAPQVEGEGRKKWSVHPTVEGTYVVHVFLTQSAADKGEASTYELSVTRK